MAVLPGRAAPGGPPAIADPSARGPIAGDVPGFLEVVTHDLRAPIAAVRTMISILSQGHLGELQAPQADLLQRVERRLESLQALVDDLIDLAAVRAGWDSGGGADVCAAARRACGRVARDAGAPGPAVFLEEASGPVQVAMGASGLDLVLHHLLGNAIKYGGGRGVRVRVERLEDHARVTVADAGIGIPDEEMRHLFEPLFRAPGARAVAPGSGLGLLIVREAVERCAGTVEIESAEGTGTAVTLRLPLADAAGPPLPGTPSTPGTPSAGGGA